MKKAINAWSCCPEADFDIMFKELKAAGLNAVELNIDKPTNSRHSLTMDTTDSELSEIKRLSDFYGLPVCSISTSLYGGTIGSADPAERQMAKAVLEKQLYYAKALEATGILAVPGGITDRVSIEQAYANSRETISSCIDIINGYKICVGLENVWNTFFLSPFDMCNFVDSFNCDYITAYYDAGNTAAISYPEYWIQILGSRISHVHIKGFKRNGGFNRGGNFVDLLKGDIRWDKVIAALQQAGFDGYITAEVEKTDKSQRYSDFYNEVARDIGTILEKGGKA